jgi:hypothetical protein
MGTGPVTPSRGAEERGLERALSDERKRLIHRYMVESDSRQVADAEELERPQEEIDADRPLLAEAGDFVAWPTLELVENPSGHGQSNDDGGPRRARRGRPPGRKVRRQVHFHVDAEQDRMLLTAAGRFGSQQKALIAALYALHDVLTLREQVEMLQAECERQQRLLAEAKALFKTT